ncbi:MAG: heme exporter protein CcmD [Steroidobacteraceae bacterium]|nr:heme exporter protein CcmD [Steroidobacteraceae bacterium]
MGGYAAFVWPSLALVLFVLVWNAVAARRLHAAAIRQALRRADARGSQP